MGFTEEKKASDLDQQIIDDAKMLAALLDRTDPDCSYELFRAVQKLEKKLSKILKAMDDIQQ